MAEEGAEDIASPDSQESEFLELRFGFRRGERLGETWFELVAVEAGRVGG